MFMNVCPGGEGGCMLVVVVVNPVRLTHGNIDCTLDVIPPFKGVCFHEIFCLKGKCSFIGVFGGSEE